MYEELYIIADGKRHKLDLSTPSGITLNYKSNIFGDLSKITCSYSYTFKLPMTANNRRILECADDVRCASGRIRRRLKAEYIQNGIPLFRNANLYIDTVETGFSAVMTWGVIDGFQTLKDNDISIRELEYKATLTYGPCNDVMADWKNTRDYANPLYNAGLPYVTENGNKDTASTYSVFPPPVIPVYRLIQLINSHFGTSFKFGTSFSYGDEETNHKLINYGVIPLVTATAPESDKEANKFASYLGCYMYGPYAGVEHILTGAKNDPTPTNSLYSLVKDANGFTVGIKINSEVGINFEIDGCIHAKFTHEPNAYSGQGRVEMGAPDSTGITPKLTFYYTTNGTSSSSIGSVEGKFSWNNDWCWMFDFAKERGKERIKGEVPPGAVIFCAIEAEANNLQMKESTVWKLVTFYPDNDANNIKWSELENRAGSFSIDLISNLPDLSCMTFLKTLYFMIGAFPVADSSNNIIPLYYSVIQENVKKQNALDWSSKVIGAYSDQPAKISYAINGFGQRNFYIMKNDNLDGDAKEDENDVYETGMGCIVCENEILKRNKTIIQLPYFGPYIKNKKAPSVSTGNTIKFWMTDGDEVSVVEAKPAFGLVVPFVQKNSSGPTGKVWLGMKIWNEFPEINSDPSYSYLSKIMENPLIITEKLRLNEFDLRDVDYSIPVYLSKYGAYFAIVSITRDSKGVCKCELIKLPEED
mgnify:CR=1 FL=1